jgi:hypothetical protein
MRRFPLLLVAALAVLAAIPSSALADPPADGGPGEDPCPVPEITHHYDTAHFTVHATLLASGCPAREHREFAFSAFISRVDQASGEGHGRVVGCGPFRSASDMGPGEPPHTFSCDVALAMDHPSHEAARYRVEVTYPGVDGEETLAFESFCESNADGTSCEETYHPATPVSPDEDDGVG